MADRIGEEYDAVICSVTSFGFFAKTENLCEGLVSIDSLGGGFYYDKDNYTLSRGKTSYKLGMNVKVRVKDVDIALKQINYELVREKDFTKENEVEEKTPIKEKSYDKSLTPKGKKGKRQNRSRDTHFKRKR